VLRRSLDVAKMNGGDKLEGFRRLNNLVEAVETDLRPEADLPSLVEHELALSPALGGRSVRPGRKEPARRAITRQMQLF
jgi:hypothetical protein